MRSLPSSVSAGWCERPLLWKLAMARKAKVTFRPSALTAWGWGGKVGNINPVSSLSRDTFLRSCGEKGLAAINQGLLWRPPSSQCFTALTWARI